MARSVVDHKLSVPFTLPSRDEDFAKFNERETDMKLMQSQYQQMKIRLKPMEKIQEEMEENARQDFLLMLLKCTSNFFVFL